MGRGNSIHDDYSFSAASNHHPWPSIARGCANGAPRVAPPSSGRTPLRSRQIPTRSACRRAGLTAERGSRICHRASGACHPVDDGRPRHPAHTSHRGGLRHRRDPGRLQRCRCNRAPPPHPRPGRRGRRAPRRRCTAPTRDARRSRRPARSPRRRPLSKLERHRRRRPDDADAAVTVITIVGTDDPQSRRGPVAREDEQIVIGGEYELARLLGHGRVGRGSRRDEVIVRAGVMRARRPRRSESSPPVGAVAEAVVATATSPSPSSSSRGRGPSRTRPGSPPPRVPAVPARPGP